MSHILGIIGLFFALAQCVHSARILFFFSGGTYSHEISVAPLVKKLAANHSITFLSAHEKKPFNLPNVEIIAPQVLMDYIADEYSVERISARLDNEELKIWNDLPLWSMRICDILLNSEDKQLQNLFRKRQFDLVFVDAVLCDCGFIASYIFKAKTIIIDSTTVLPWYYDIYNLPKESAWVPQVSTAPHYPMGFYDRMLNYFDTFYWTAFRRLKMYPAMEITMRKFFGHNDFPAFVELERNVSLVFLNTHYATDFARALPPSFVQIGGLQLWEDDDPIPKDILTIMDKSEKVILITFGSSVEMDKMPKSIRNIFMESIRESPDITFIWKWNGKIPDNAPKNIHFAKWLPQKEILGHKKTAAFISHGGVNSIMEATYHGVPIIVFPLFADQDSNSYRVMSQNIGIRLEMRDLTEDIFIKAIKDVVSQKTYKNNMEVFSRAFRDRPMPPLDTALYWINYVLTHDNLGPLKPNIDHLSFIQLYHFDLALVIFLAALLVSLTLIFIIKCAISMSRSPTVSPSGSKSTKKKATSKKKN